MIVRDELSKSKGNCQATTLCSENQRRLFRRRCLVPPMTARSDTSEYGSQRRSGVLSKRSIYFLRPQHNTLNTRDYIIRLISTASSAARSHWLKFSFGQFGTACSHSLGWDLFQPGRLGRSIAYCWGSRRLVTLLTPGGFSGMGNSAWLQELQSRGLPARNLL